MYLKNSFYFSVFLCGYFKAMGEEVCLENPPMSVLKEGKNSTVTTSNCTFDLTINQRYEIVFCVAGLRPTYIIRAYIENKKFPSFLIASCSYIWYTPARSGSRVLTFVYTEEDECKRSGNITCIIKTAPEAIINRGVPLDTFSCHVILATIFGIVFYCISRVY